MLNHGGQQSGEDHEEPQHTRDAESGDNENLRGKERNSDDDDEQLLRTGETRDVMAPEENGEADCSADPGDADPGRFNLRVDAEKP